MRGYELLNALGIAFCLGLLVAPLVLLVYRTSWFARYISLGLAVVWLAVLVELLSSPSWHGPAAIVLMPAVPLLLATAGVYRHWSRPVGPTYPAGCCQKCGYDLTGNVSGTCPECGTEIGQPDPPKEDWLAVFIKGPRARRFVLLLSAVSLTLGTLLKAALELEDGTGTQAIARRLMLPAILAVILWLAYVDQRRR
jgi:hypothetical protein